MKYKPETLASDDDDGTMPSNVAQLEQAVIGRRIVSAKHDPDVEHGPSYWRQTGGFVITLDDGTQVMLQDKWDCCAYTSLEKFFLHAERIDHAITGVGTTGGYTKWHIHADMGDVLSLDVGWSCGNPFYYGYGFDISVIPLETKEETV